KGSAPRDVTEGVGAGSPRGRSSAGITGGGKSSAPRDGAKEDGSGRGGGPSSGGITGIGKSSPPRGGPGDDGAGGTAARASAETGVDPFGAWFPCAAAAAANSIKMGKTRRRSRFFFITLFSRRWQPALSRLRTR